MLVPEALIAPPVSRGVEIVRIYRIPIDGKFDNWAIRVHRPHAVLIERRRDQVLWISDDEHEYKVEFTKNGTPFEERPGGKPQEVFLVDGTMGILSGPPRRGSSGNPDKETRIYDYLISSSDPNVEPLDPRVQVDY